MIDAFCPFAMRPGICPGFGQRCDEEIDITDAQIDSARATNDFSIQAASEPRCRCFRVFGAELKMVPFKFDHAMSP
jgi:hypothetical protein